MKQVTATGQTVDEAVASALEQLETKKEFVEVKVIEQGKKGLFGIFGARPAIVKVMVTFNPIEEAEKFLEKIASDMGITAKIEVEQNGNSVVYNLTGEKIGLLIGKRGQTLNSLQYLTYLVANRHSDKYISVTVDAENYRKRRIETLRQLANRLAEKAIRTKQKIELEPMPSFERKVIHSALYHNKQVATESVGKEPKRHIVIVPKG